MQECDRNSHETTIVIRDVLSSVDVDGIAVVVFGIYSLIAVKDFLQVNQAASLRIGEVGEPKTVIGRDNAVAIFVYTGLCAIERIVGRYFKAGDSAT